MTSVPTAFQPTPIGIRAGASGFVHSRVTAIGARTVVEIDARGSDENKGGALTPADGRTWPPRPAWPARSGFRWC